MNVKDALLQQYHASLVMLEFCIKECPTALWEDDTYTNRFWHIAYHTLFYTQLYVYESEKAFQKWEKWKKDYQFLGAPRSVVHEVYSQADLLEYLKLCKKEIDEKIMGANLEAESGFDWIPFSQFELQLYNIRHIHHHTGQLSERLRTVEGVAVKWVGIAK